MEAQLSYVDVWWISLAGFLILWPISLIRRDASIVDFWWGPGFGAMALAFWWGNGAATDPRTVLLLVLLLVWSVRLGVHLGYRRVQEGREDARYAEMRAARSPHWAIKSLFLVFVLQAVLQGVIGYGVVISLAEDGGTIGALGTAGALLAATGILLQTIADVELDRYRNDAGPHGLLRTGLRAYVRYPNYLGEILFWSGLAAIATEGGNFLSVGSAVIVYLLLRYVSGVPILDDRMQRTRPDFDDYARRTPALFPRLNRRQKAVQQ